MKKEIKKVQKPKVAATTAKNSASSVTWLLGILLVCTFIAFMPSLKNELTNWDDPTYINDNPLIRELSAENIKTIFSKPYFANYQPLHILSYAIEYSMFGLSPKGYHLVSMLMHLIAVVLVFYFIKKLNIHDYVALAVAAAFALSPMRTESVCWASERKDLLYAIFFFAACISYINYLNAGSIARQYLLTCIFFLLAVMSKAMAVSFVPIMVLLDIYYTRKPDIKMILDKVFFVALSIVFGLISVQASASEGSIDTTNKYSFVDRIFFASHNLMMYAVKSIIPFMQSSFYPYPVKDEGGIAAYYYIAALFPVVLAFLFFYFYKKEKLISFSIGFFVATLALVLMLIPVGPTIFSERYTYISSVAVYLVLFYLLHKYLSKQLFVATTMLAAIVFAVLTYNRCAVWKDSITLWTDATQKYPTAGLALNNLGDACYKLGMIEEAEKHFTSSINANGEYAQAWFNRGNCRGQLNRIQDAYTDLNRSIALKKDYAEAYNKRGQALSIMGKPQEALKDYTKSLELKPNNPEVYYNLSLYWHGQQNTAEACRYLRMSLELHYTQAQKLFDDLCR
ncbi:MAG: tetratricopeptide repeat protein [Bacteroidetes bacterium]|nr:tetratricopeptide repeat protein [Bacteroidota bacterium]